MSIHSKCLLCLASAEPDGEGGTMIRHSRNCEWYVWEKPSMKFKENQPVWIFNGMQPKVPGIVRTAQQTETGNYYGVEVLDTQHQLTFTEAELSARGVVERIGGLAKVRQQMAEDELVADQAAHESYDGCLGVPEEEWTADQLMEKYDTVRAWGEHPRFSMYQWRQQVADGNTRAGYWNWVSYKLNE